MPDCIVKPSRLEGSIAVPSSKSQSIRALLFAALAKGESRIYGLLDSPDVEAMRQLCLAFGADIRLEGKTTIVRGVAGHLATPQNVIDVGNSGLVLRFTTALAALTPGYTVITGDASIRTNRVTAPLLEGLRQWGALALSTLDNERPPLIIRGPLQGASYAHIEGQDSQPVSALLIAGSLGAGPFQLEVENPSEFPWIDMTLDWLERLGVSVERRGYHWYQLEGRSCYSAFEYTVPGDWSSAAFPLAAALLTDSPFRVENVDEKHCQGDRQLVELLQAAGAALELKGSSLSIGCSPHPLQALQVDCSQCIDAVPILAVIGTQAKGTTILRNAAIARQKESNRLKAMCQELRKMGARIQESVDGLIIESSSLHGATVDSHGDHRVAMALAVAGLIAKGETRVQAVDCVSKTYPHFFDTLAKQGADFLCAVCP